MHIRIFQSGGFAGERIQLKEISDQQLPPEKRPLLQMLLDNADTFYATKDKQGNGEIGADLLYYEIEVPDKKGTHVYKFTKTSANKPMTDLLDFLMSL